ncbi:FecR family protein [Pedobacter hartonius]|uniref:FecR family protein n=1 Tax=Pedobacter hartonius TaxID=425514 RepID=A0A1H4ETG9_9SPHI|nr:FecR family protein [Pedobacter hartonius]SEA88335.1 FecR family protein [Pedobacter hartonius]
MDQKDIAEKHKRFISGEGTTEDIAFFESFYIQYNQKHFQTTEAEQSEDIEEAWKQINAVIRTPKRKLSLSWLAAAAVLLIVSTIFIYVARHHSDPATTSVYANDIPPGSHKAILTLSDGRKINLDDRNKGLVTSDANATIRKTNTGEIIYESSRPTAQIAYNRMSTPVGGKYELRLSDGTLAVLDAGSSIEYPVSFIGEQRQVEVSGQVYFEVSHDPKRPFLVKFNDQVVKVLGTRFNINAHADEPDSRTTLLQGCIALQSGGTETLLKPGQQGILQKGQDQVSVVNVNADKVVSWKDNYFHFEKENIREIMRQLSRWYNIEVVFEGAFKEEEFSGDISRNKNISQVLRMLEYSQAVHFKISGRRVIVMP